MLFTPVAVALAPLALLFAPVAVAAPPLALANCPQAVAPVKVLSVAPLAAGFVLTQINAWAGVGTNINPVASTKPVMTPPASALVENSARRAGRFAGLSLNVTGGGGRAIPWPNRDPENSSAW